MKNLIRQSSLSSSTYVKQQEREAFVPDYSNDCRIRARVSNHGPEARSACDLFCIASKVFAFYTFKTFYMYILTFKKEKDYTTDHMWLAKP